MLLELRHAALKVQAVKVAQQLVALTDPVELALLHSSKARALASWRYFWIARHKDEAWVAISVALVKARTHQVIQGSGSFQVVSKSVGSAE